MSRFINKEEVERFTAIGMILAFIGVCIMSLSAVKEKDQLQDSEDPFASTKVFGLFCALGGAFGFAVVTNTSRRLKTVNPFTIVWFLCTIGLATSLTLLVLEFVFISRTFRFATYPWETIRWGIAGGLADTV